MCCLQRKFCDAAKLRSGWFFACLAEIALSSCGPSLQDIIVQSAPVLRCPEDDLGVTGLEAKRWYVSGCSRALIYDCTTPKAPCRTDRAPYIAQAEAPQQPLPAAIPPSRMPAALPPGPMNWPGRLYHPGEYNPNTGAIQRSYTNQFTTPPRPSPPPLPPLYRR